MPNLEEHCRQSFIRYGYDFAEIHSWMDSPSLVYGKAHRKIRHDINSTPYEAEKRFRDYVQDEQRDNIRYAVIDHIQLDERNTKKEQLTRHIILKYNYIYFFSPLSTLSLSEE